MEGHKRKRPPTFQHYPAKRAKKLKHAWVQAKKVKTRWRHEKRTLEQKSGADMDDMGDEEEWGGIAVDWTLQGDPAKEEDVEWALHGDIAPNSEQTARASASKMAGRTPPRKQDVADSQAHQSLRDLAREAYSRSSLHQYKSDPLHRRRGAIHGNTRGHHPDLKARGRGHGQGRGKPDMRLRMAAMLGKIKRDMS